MPLTPLQLVVVLPYLIKPVLNGGTYFGEQRHAKTLCYIFFWNQNYNDVSTGPYVTLESGT